jgi:predicted nucleic acid-binding protein
VDTNVVSFAFKGDCRARQYAAALEYSDLAISFMTLAETERWIIARNWGELRIAARRQFSSRFLVLPVTHETCRLWAEIMETMRGKGLSISFPDAWIAASALELSCPLVTHNSRHFAAIDGLDIWNP